MLFFRKNGMQVVARQVSKEEREFYDEEYVTELFVISLGHRVLVSKSYGTKEQVEKIFHGNVREITEPIPF